MAQYSIYIIIIIELGDEWLKATDWNTLYYYRLYSILYNYDNMYITLLLLGLLIAYYIVWQPLINKYIIIYILNTYNKRQTKPVIF